MTTLVAQEIALSCRFDALRDTSRWSGRAIEDHGATQRAIVLVPQVRDECTIDLQC
jgi:hypothetical protein